MRKGPQKGSLLTPLPITPRLLWAGIASGNSGSIPGDIAAGVTAKQKKNLISRDSKITREHNAYRGMESAGPTAVMTKTSAAMKDTFIV